MCEETVQSKKCKWLCNATWTHEAVTAVTVITSPAHFGSWEMKIFINISKVLQKSEYLRRDTGLPI